MRSGIVDENGELHQLRKHEIPSAFNGYSTSDIWNGILHAMRTDCDEHASLLPSGAGIVVAFPGPVRERRYPLCAPTVAGETPYVPDIAGQLAQWTGRTVWLLNDVSAAAWHIGTHLDADPFMVVTVSSGIGSKMFHRAGGGHVFDEIWYGGEIGHLVVDASPDAVACSCGGAGHLGAIASGRGTQMLARRIALSDPAAFERSLCATQFAAHPDGITNEAHLVPAAVRGDEWSWAVVRCAMQPLAQTLAAVTQAAGLKRIVIIGGFALELGQRYIDELARAMSVYCDGGVCSAAVDDLLLLWAFDDEPCLRGAGAFGNMMERSNVPVPP